MATTGFVLPPLTINDRGETRHVGFEFELGGIDLETCADIIVRLFGGRKKTRNRFHLEVVGTRYGDFSIESDASLLKHRKYRDYLKKMGLDIDRSDFATKLEDFIATATADLVPYEIVTPPIPLGALASVERLREALHEEGAQGTHTSFLAAFGFQFNPELPALDTRTLLLYMRAFFLLYDCLRASEDIPIARRVLPYIEPFPENYIAKVLDAKYDPDRRGFIRDYLDANPTRNRPVDWLPLFTYLEKDLVFQYDVEKDLIKPRPTLHYRLPSCLIDDPKWTISLEWNKWIGVERLAADPVRVDELAREYLDLHQPFALRSESRWIERSKEWLCNDVRET